jgi:hypothetical protein
MGTTQAHGEAADLLAAVRLQQVRTRRRLGFGWLVAALAGFALILAAATDGAGASPRISALVSGGLLFVVGAAAILVLRRNTELFGVTLDVETGLLVGALAGVALSTAWFAARNEAQPPHGSRAVGAAVGLIVIGVIDFLLAARRRPEMRWVGAAMALVGAVVAVGVAVSPHSYVPRELMLATACLAYAVVGFVRAGRQA